MRIIPILLFQLTSKEIQPQDFVSELSDWLDVSSESARTLAREIEEKILEPIKRPLLNWGIDISLIKIGALSEELRPIIAPPPPLPPDLPPEASAKGGALAQEGATTPKISIFPSASEPQKSYTPPPPPAPGKSFEPSFMGGAPRTEDLGAKKIRAIGGTHGIGEESEREDKSFGEAQDKPFIIHKEPSLEPVSKDLPYAIPSIPSSQNEQKNIPRPDLVARAREGQTPWQDLIPKKEHSSHAKEKPFGEARGKPVVLPPKPVGKNLREQTPHNNPDLAEQAKPRKEVRLPESSFKIVHYDEEELAAKEKFKAIPKPSAPLDGTLRGEHSVKQNVLAKPADLPMLPDKDVHKNKPGPKVKGNMVDLR